MMQIGPRKIIAGITTALIIQGYIGVFVFGVTNFHYPGGCEQIAIAPVASGHHAVKHVDTMSHRPHQIYRRTHPHEITGFVLGHLWSDVVEYPEHVFLALANGQTTNSVAVKLDILQPAQTDAAQILEHPALHDAE